MENRKIYNKLIRYNAKFNLDKYKMKKPFFSVFLLTASSFMCSYNSNKKEINLEANRDVIRKYHEAKSKGQVAELKKG